MNQERLKTVNLCLFGEAAENAPSAEAGGKAGEALPGGGRRANSGEISRVIYGRPGNAFKERSSEESEGSAAGSEERPLTREEKRAKFRELVNSGYKDIYAEEFQTAFDRRFRASKEAQEALAAQKPVIDLLLRRYRIEDGNLEALKRALLKAPDEAPGEGKSEEAERRERLEALRRESRDFMEGLREAEGERAVNRRIEGWHREAEALKERCPAFDFAAECKNPQFLSLLKAGLPVHHAYEVSHFEDIKRELVQSTARSTEKRVMDGIRARGARPVENGSSSQSGVTFKPDVSRLTREDREEIARRVSRGENITF